MRVRRTAHTRCRICGRVGQPGSAAGLALATVSRAARTGAHPSGVRVVLDGASLQHTFIPSGPATAKTEALSSPDDITMLGGHLFAGFQNGVGPQGEPSADGNTDSTVVEFTPAGHVLGKWDIKGKCDGLTADPRARLVIATVNEDAHSSLYTITAGRARPAPESGTITYSKPLPHFGGTDAISSTGARCSSAPRLPARPARRRRSPATRPSTSRGSTRRGTWSACSRCSPTRPPRGSRTSAATSARGSGSRWWTRTRMRSCPAAAPRFGGDFMLTSQGDQEQIFVARGRAGLALRVLHLSRSVDDTAWVRTRSGRLFGSNTGRRHGRRRDRAVPPRRDLRRSRHRATRTTPRRLALARASRPITWARSTRGPGA